MSVISITVEDVQAAQYDIEAYVEDMQPGWNLGNTYDAVGYDETAWGNPRVTRVLIDSIAEQGFNSIRIPITFDQRMSGTPNYRINDDFLERITDTVDWSLEAGMKVMINIHHDSWIWLETGMPNNHQATIARFNAIWEQLANHFKDYPIDLMFESINEPRFQTDANTAQGYLDQLNTSFYNIVRGSGGNNAIRPLVIPTMDTGAEPEKLNSLYHWMIHTNDPHLISTIHYYGFWPFSVNIAGHTTFDQQTKDHIHETFDRVYQQFVANGIPVVIGEFGLLGFDTHVGTVQQGEKLKFFEYMIHYANEKNLVHMLWDNGQHFNRHELQWNDHEFYDIMQASWSGRSSTAEADYIYLERGQPVSDVTLKLNLNGNQFTGLSIDGQWLNPNVDYQLNGDLLTIKASLLESLTQNNQLGHQAKLTASFNQGANWYFNLHLYDKPILSDTTDSVANFAIPIEFKGNHLATMEAVYHYGQPAGPQNWTSYKEFGYAFSPDYQQNLITFPYERFFNEVHDNQPVILTLHFWSGETVTYQVEKNGSQVTGTVINQ